MKVDFTLSLVPVLPLHKRHWVSETNTRTMTMSAGIAPPSLHLSEGVPILLQNVCRWRLGKFHLLGFNIQWSGSVSFSLPVIFACWHDSTVTCRTIHPHRRVRFLMDIASCLSRPKTWHASRCITWELHVIPWTFVDICKQLSGHDGASCNSFAPFVLAANDPVSLSPSPPKSETP